MRRCADRPPGAGVTPVVAVAAAAAIGALARPWLRARIFANSVAYGRPLRHACPRCHNDVAATRSARLPATGCCPGCRRRLGPVTGLVEATGTTVLALLAWTNPDAKTCAAAARPAARRPGPGERLLSSTGRRWPRPALNRSEIDPNEG
ncbi:MAG: leader peptidase (prepilin peptidase) / N-methyltransferase [Actinoplanes sp.]|jgi:leader peptidase (prepilin peptidase)/N-methyltransferase|nr:leader peptidase (prepilin peptidase) / N-methyltransferase [Actinoplanes sp.]